MMKHNYLMSINEDDWNDLQMIKKLTDAPFSELMREGLRSIVKEKKEEISETKRMREKLSQMSDNFKNFGDAYGQGN